MSHRERARDWLFKQTLREPDAHVVDDLEKLLTAVDAEARVDAVLKLHAETKESA